MLTIGSISVDPPLVLAPMSGITDSPFRRVLKELGGCGLVFTELISSEALFRRHPKTLEMLRFAEQERPLGIQIFGADPERMAAAAKEAEQAGADFVDINLGCPVRKVVQTGAGAQLLRDLPALACILAGVRRSVRIPVTAKIRAGWDAASINAVEVARVAEEAGAAAVTLHARTRHSGYAGKADWRWIADLRRAVGIPVIGNGDVQRPEDARRMLEETGCQGVMIGRAVLTNPWILRQAWQALRGEPYRNPTPRERWQVFLRFLAIAREDRSDRFLLDRLKKFSCYFTHELPGSSRLRNLIQRSARLDDLLRAVEDFLAQSGGGPAVRCPGD